jgi:hypothetical protein
LCSVHAALALGIEVKASPLHGFGLFTTSIHEKRTRICSYSGTRLTYHAAIDAYGRSVNFSSVGKTRRRKPNSEYLFRVSTDEYIDATATTSCFARYINLAPLGIAPNVRINKIGHIVATRTIQVGEELIMAYNRGKPSHAAAKHGRRQCSAVVAAAARRCQHSLPSSLPRGQASTSIGTRDSRTAKRLRHSDTRASSYAARKFVCDIAAAVAASLESVDQSVTEIPPHIIAKGMPSTGTHDRDEAFLRAHKEVITEEKAERLRRKAAAVLAAFERKQV